MAFIALGACPEQENSVEPIGPTKDYIPVVRKEVYKYLDLLRNRFRDMLKENYLIRLEVRCFGSDTQPFLNVIVIYDETDEIQSQCATIISENLPQTWGDLAEFYACL